MGRRMGTKDSSKTRVAPVFDFLFARHGCDVDWLPLLLRLPTGGYIICVDPNWDFTIEHKGWGSQEKRLEPPVSLLSWLIRHSRMPRDGKLSKNPMKAQKRRELIEGSDNRLREGLSLLRDNPSREDWHILEGATQPDVFIQTPDVMIVIEGKRTESETTKNTKWMPGRHQMWRHIDCAWEIKGKREVFGFFVVEGDGLSGDVPARWMDEAKAIMSQAALASSLPHRGPDEQEVIRRCFLGVTTWQRVCNEFGIDWDLLPDVAD
jgi:hypothetical protein